MTTTKKWRERADQYREMAAGTKDPDIRRRIMAMAKNCEDLAEVIERRERAEKSRASTRSSSAIDRATSERTRRVATAST